MSGHETFDHTVQQANIWLKKITETLHFEDRRYAYSALRATLHALRDRLTPESAVHLSAQLPMVIRGLYFEGWRISGKPTNDHTVDEFCAHIEKELPPKFPRDPKSVAQGVFEVLWAELDVGETAKVIDQMPGHLKALWPQEAR
ncbi:DUF2267 domain-containing protein [Pelagibacterium halotolerans]|uniref:DUF2267 domain-containing protein n=1 Tax=Pelagibacterium halotolerans TaxID=531813 RepID=UPI00384D2FFE